MPFRSPLCRFKDKDISFASFLAMRLQIIAAIALIPLTLWLVVMLVFQRGADYDTARAWLSSLSTVSFLSLWLVCLACHAHFGLQRIVKDHVAAPALAQIASIAVTLGTLVVTVYALVALIFVVRPTIV